MTQKKSWTIAGTLLTDLFFLWVIVKYAMGGWRLGLYLLTHNGIIPWLILLGVLFLLLYRSDYRTDLPIFVAAVALGYWGEWWGTTRGLWVYWNGQTPPSYLPPLWGIGLLTVYRLHLLLKLDKSETPISRWLKAASLVALPGLAFANSWSLLAVVDWAAVLDIHFWAGLLVASGLILFKFDLNEAFWLYLCGTILGGTYEYLGTFWGEWRYVTGEVPPLWIAPLWGLASVAMVKLGTLIRTCLKLPSLTSRLFAAIIY
jgi:hypothetical protein